MIQTNWHVITGGPSAGKTTLIEQLAQRGYCVAPEVARDYIKQFLAQNYTLEYITQHALQLQRGILALALKRERRLERNRLIFFDRGTVDSLAYFQYHHLEAAHVLHACQRIRYKKVFYCQQLPVVADSVRIEDNTSAKEIGALIYKAYEQLGYSLIELPNSSVEQRINIILSHINS